MKGYRVDSTNQCRRVGMVYTLSTGRPQSAILSHP